MSKNTRILSGSTIAGGYTAEKNRVHSLQEKTGATAKQIRIAIEKIGFDRDKVEQYLIEKQHSVFQNSGGKLL